jgi:uncharacterized protein (TIGR03086 family)
MDEKTELPARPDLLPSALLMARLLEGVRDDQLPLPTPCPDYTVADLCEHVVGLTAEFTLSARKSPAPEAPGPVDGARLAGDWRRQVGTGLVALGEAWRQDGAWVGETHAGPVTLPAPVTAEVALDELVVHAWDVAVATGQPYDPDPAAVETCLRFVASFDAPADDGGLFGPPVPTTPDAPALDRLVALTGRDPRWPSG